MTWSFRLFSLRLIFIFKKAFLPNGYPHTVSEDYLQYQLWDSVQAFASSIMNNLATQAVFKGVGVGDSSATVLAATITWLLKDGTSIIGSLIFATVQSTMMDSYCKRWRLFADILNDIAICVDLLSSTLSHPYFTIVQCFSGILRSLVGIAGGATRAALTQHQAKCNNMADVSAKDGSQERMVNLFALLFSLVLIPIISEKTEFIWLLFTLFTTLHIYANYRAIKTVSINAFNGARLACIMEHHLTKSNDLNGYRVDMINRKENVWFFNTFDKYDRYFRNVTILYNSSKEAQAGDNKFSIPFTIISNENHYKVILHEKFNTKTRHHSSRDNTTKIIKALFQIFVERFEHERIDGYSLTKDLDLFLERIDKAGWNLNHLLMFEFFAEQDSSNEEEEGDDSIKKNN